ncbi:hypothetical protein ACFL0D_04190, partial [Thermoproteota archaeon]
MTQYIEIILSNMWKNRIYFTAGILSLIFFLIIRRFQKNRSDYIQESDTIEEYSQLEYNVEQWAIYRHILFKLVSPQTNEELQNTEIGAISELNGILWELEKWGGLTFTDGV